MQTVRPSLTVTQAERCRLFGKSDSANQLLPTKVEGVVGSTAPAADMASGHLREGTGKPIPLSFYSCRMYSHRQNFIKK